MEGIVKWYDRKKGYGFIQGDDGKDYFAHYTDLQEGVFIRENDKVAFEPAEGEKGVQAKEIQLLEKGSERQEESTEEPEEDKGNENISEPTDSKSEEAPEEEPAEETPEEKPAEEKAPKEKKAKKE